MEAGIIERGNEVKGYYDRDWVNWLKAHTNGFCAELVPSIPVDAAGNMRCRNKYTMGKFVPR